MFLPDQYVACLFRKSLLIFFVLLFTASFICVLLMFQRLFFVCNKTVYHPALENYHTSTPKNIINSVNYLHNRSPKPINFLDNFQLHRRTVRPMGFDSPPIKMFGHRNRLLIFSDVRTAIIFGGPKLQLPAYRDLLISTRALGAQLAHDFRPIRQFSFLEKNFIHNFLVFETYNLSIKVLHITFSKQLLWKYFFSKFL